MTRQVAESESSMSIVMESDGIFQISATFRGDLEGEYARTYGQILNYHPNY
jgi:hypothetical protein